MKAIRQQISKEQFHLFNIPDDFAEEVEIIILALKPSKKYGQLSDEESFYAANNNQILEDDKSDDEIWSKY
jgi:hypothetical protein